MIARHQQGLDLRNHPSNTPQGSFIELRNCHLNRGGEVEKRKAFVAYATLPYVTVGLFSFSGALVVFGTGPRPEMDPKIGYEQINTTKTLEAVNGATRFNGGIYAVCRFTDGSIGHYYKGEPVAYWQENSFANVDTADAVASYLADRIDSDASYLANASGSMITVEGADFDYVARVLGGEGLISGTETQAYQARQIAASAQASLVVSGADTQDITSITVDGIEVLGATIAWATDDETFAQAIADQITAYSGYVGERSENTVILTAPIATGASQNGKALAVFGSATFTSVTNMLGGQDEVGEQSRIVEFAITPPFNPDATYQIVLNGKGFSKFGGAYISSDFVRTYQRRVFAVAGEYLYFSALGDGTEWEAFVAGEEGNEEQSIGAGFLHISDYAGDSSLVRSVAPFGEQLAAFSGNSITLISTNPDPKLIGVTKIIEGTGTKYANAVYPLGASDLLYVSETGINSLRLREQIASEYAEDIGAPIDSMVVKLARALGESKLESLCAASDPDGRTMFFIGDKALVLSFFPSMGIKGWSLYDLPGVVDSVARINDRLFIRCGDEVFLYGGTDGETYDGTEAVAITGFDVAGNPHADSKSTEIVALVTGEWRLNALLDPKRLNVRHSLGRFNDSDEETGRHKVNLSSKAIAIEARTTFPGPCVLHRAGIE
jgi:hypothetical protein